jgi:hypothetical protein
MPASAPGNTVSNFEANTISYKGANKGTNTISYKGANKGTHAISNEPTNPNANSRADSCTHAISNEPTNPNANSRANSSTYTSFSCLQPSPNASRENFSRQGRFCMCPYSQAATQVLGLEQQWTAGLGEHSSNTLTCSHS